MCRTLPLYVLDQQRKQEGERAVKEPWEHLNTILIQRLSSEVGKWERDGHRLPKMNRAAANSQWRKDISKTGLFPLPLSLCWLLFWRAGDWQPFVFRGVVGRKEESNQCSCKSLTSNRLWIPGWWKQEQVRRQIKRNKKPTHGCRGNWQVHSLQLSQCHHWVGVASTT